jgi:hypothetical protein
VTRARARGPKNRGDLVDLGDLIDDETVEALVAGRPVDPRFDHLAAFTHEARALSDRPPPKPSAALAAYVARGGAPAAAAAPAATTPPRPRRRHAVAASLARLGLAAKIAIGASVGAVSVAAAGAAGVLPEPANREVRHLIEAATPIEFPEPADGAPAGERAPTTEGPDPTRPSRSAAGQDERGNRGGRAPMAASRPAEHQPADERPVGDRPTDTPGPTPGSPGRGGAPTTEGPDPTRPSRPVGQDEGAGQAAVPAEPGSGGARAPAAGTQPAEREPVDQEGRAPAAVAAPDERELPNPDAPRTSSSTDPGDRQSAGGAAGAVPALPDRGAGRDGAGWGASPAGGRPPESDAVGEVGSPAVGQRLPSVTTVSGHGDRPGQRGHEDDALEEAVHHRPPGERERCACDDGPGETTNGLTSRR